MRTHSLLLFIGIFSATLISKNSLAQNVDDLYHFAQRHKDQFRLSAYITVGSVEAHLSDVDGRREAISVLRSLGVTKAFIETYRSGQVASPELLKTVRDYFNTNGLETAAGIATTPGKDFGVPQAGRLSWFNFQHPKTQADLEPVVRMTARIFDGIIVDDFLCTEDTSEISIKARGDKSWSQYRRDLLTEMSQKIFINPARAENPRINIIIKYPQWYDRFHLFGYDVVREPALFDQVWVGTETRGLATRRMGFVPQYEGFVNFRWLSSLAPDKIGGAWFDHIDCDANDFIEQAFQSTLAGAREIILFNYGNLMQGHPGHHLLRRQFATLVKLAQMVHQHSLRGIAAYKPPHSNACHDHYIFDFLGMIGIPLVPVSRYPANSEVIFLPTQAATDEKLVSQIEASVASGKTLIFTPGLLNQLSSYSKLETITGVKIVGSITPITSKQLIIENKIVNFETTFDFAAKLKSFTAANLLTAIDNSKELPVLTLKVHPSGAKVFVLNFHTFSEPDFKAVNEVLLAPKPVSWLELPADWLNKIRQAFTEPLGFGLVSPGRVSLHPFGNSEWVICNFNDTPVEVALQVFHQPVPTTVTEMMSGENLNVFENTIKLNIGKRQIRWIKM